MKLPCGLPIPSLQRHRAEHVEVDFLFMGLYFTIYADTFVMAKEEERNICNGSSGIQKYIYIWNIYI